MKNLKIGKKLGISFIIILMLATFTNLYTILNLKKSEKLNDDLFTGPYVVTNEVMGARRDIVSIDQNLMNEIVSDNHSRYATLALADFDSLNKRIETLRTSFRGDQKLIDNFANSINDLKQEYQKISAVIKTEDYDKAKEMSTSENSNYVPLYRKAVENATILYDDAAALGIEHNKSVHDTVAKSTVASIVFSALSIIAGAVISLNITKGLKNPIEEIEIAANKMAAGDFDIDINYESKDELGELSNSMRQMSENTKVIIDDLVRGLGEIASGNFDVIPQVEYVGIFKNIEKSMIRITNDLSETMSQINVASEEVEGASEQVASASQMLSQGSTEQASAIQELSATIIEISEKIKDTAENAKRANNLTLSSAHQVQEGNEEMKSMVKAMEEISFTSNEIGRIIKTIDDIAFQTNILALNAAVEAARAGSAGKGFAVVADEVRNLAAKSAEAAKNTATLIENSIKAVGNGTKIVDNTAESLQKIINTTNRTTELVDEIAKASEEQATAISHVTLGVEQISDVVQTNSATAEESAASSEELSGQAQMLRTLIENFRLKDKSSSHKNINFDSAEIDYLDIDESESFA